MKILITIPHFYQPSLNPRYSSRDINVFPRLKALTANLTALHQQFGQSQAMINIGEKLAVTANQSQSHQLDIVICTTGSYHLIEELNIPPYYYYHRQTQVQSMQLGFECQAVLREELGNYDYYCYLEDDLIIHDPWFFIKLNWFTQHLGNQCVLQPNRYEAGTKGEILKAYIDGDLLPKVTEPFQNINEKKLLRGDILGTFVTFSRTLNPHSG